MRIIDISVPLGPNVPIWPGSRGIRLYWSKRLDMGYECNNTHLDCDVHTGTHVDAPSHFLVSGATVEQLSLETLMGTAVVACLPKVSAIAASDLTDLALPPGIERLLLRTRNSELWGAGVAEFREDYVALTADAAQWIVDKNIRLIGVDYLSVQRYGDSALTHEILLESDVIILEGVNLADVQPGSYELICLPMRLVGADGAPARAVLRHNDAEAVSQE